MICRVEQSVINFSRTVGNLLTKNVYPDLIQLFDLLNGIFKRQYHNGNFRDKIREIMIMTVCNKNAFQITIGL